MKLTRRQLRQLIQEGYRELQKQQASLYRQGAHMRTTGPISFSPTKAYYTALRAGLYQRGIDSQKVTGVNYFDYTLNNGHSLNVAGRISWPSGFSVVRLSFFAAYQKAGDTWPGIKFAVTGNPDIDAEFIARCCALSDDNFLRLVRKTRNGPRVGSWESEILPGYPHEFIGL